MRFKFKSSLWLVLILASCLFAACSRAPLLEEQYALKPPPAVPLSHPPKVALVLSGGGSRGVAHAGVLEVLQANNIHIDFIVGCSAGSVIGALYAMAKL